MNYPRDMQCVRCDAIFPENEHINGMCPECGCDEYVEAEDTESTEGE